jgi:hypothetical protein
MALDVENAVDDGVNEQEAFGRSGRFETLHPRSHRRIG